MSQFSLKTEPVDYPKRVLFQFPWEVPYCYLFHQNEKNRYILSAIGRKFVSKETKFRKYANQSQLSPLLVIPCGYNEA